jgi:hypothetical protein
MTMDRTRLLMPLWGAVLALLTGCAARNAGAYHESCTENPADKTRMAAMYLNVLAAADAGEGVLAFDALRLETAGKAEWSVDVSYMAKDWLFIAAGPSLFLSVDGQKATYSGPGSDPNTGRAVLADGSIVEQGIYPLPIADLRRISQGQEVLLRVKGNHGEATARFSPLNLERLRTFLEKYGAGDE